MVKVLFVLLMTFIGLDTANTDPYNLDDPSEEDVVAGMEIVMKQIQGEFVRDLKRAFEESPHIHALDPDNLDYGALGESHGWLVNFYKASDMFSKKVGLTTLKLAEQLAETKVKVATLNLEHHPNFKWNFSVASSSTFVRFEGPYAYRFEGEPVLFALKQFALRDYKNVPKFPYLTGSEIVDLDAEALRDVLENSGDKWLISFFAPWCPHSITFNPILESAALALANKGVRVGRLNGDHFVREADLFKIEGYPAVFLFGVSGDVYEYGDERTVDSISQFAFSPEKLGRKTQGKAALLKVLDERAPWAVWMGWLDKEISLIIEDVLSFTVTGSRMAVASAVFTLGALTGMALFARVTRSGQYRS